MTTLTAEVLAKSSQERFIEAANFKHQLFLINVGESGNAELIDVKPHNAENYTAKAIFRIDREATALPYGEPETKSRYFNRTVMVKQISATDIVNAYGINDLIYLGLTEVPATTKSLAAAFQSRFGLEMTEDDIVDQIIPNGANCIMVYFNPMSISYRGALRVDLNTKIQ